MGLSLTEILMVAMAVCTLLFNGLSAIFSYAIVAFDKSRYDIAPMLIARSVHIVGLIVSLQIGGLYHVMATFILATFLLTSMRAYVVNRRCFSIWPRNDWDYVRVIWRSGWKIGVGAVFGVISARSDVLLLKVMANNGVVGIYGAAYRIVNGAITGISAMASALFPRVAKAVDEGKQTLEVKLFFIIPAVIAVSALFGAVFASEFLIDLLYGEAFVAAYSVLQVLFVVVALETLIAFYNRYLVATHREALLPIAQGVGAFLNVGLNLLLIPSHGAWGAAIATVGSCSATLVCYLLVSQRKRSKKKKNTRTAH
jgi:O-antigen/teichoic acid export membrane protein